jgi:Uma2 family endonuclease
VLAPDARVELIEGEIIDMPPIGNRHAATVDRLVKLLVSAVGDRAIVRCQGPLQLGDMSELQPDLTLLTRREDFYEQRAAGAADALLVIEVSETTLRYDRQTKVPLYARHSVPELWIFDTGAKQLHVFNNPSGTTYGEACLAGNLRVTPIGSLPGIVVDLSSLL